MHEGETDEIDESDEIDVDDDGDDGDEDDDSDSDDSDDAPGGPGLPGGLGAIPPLAWLFIALGVGYVIWFIADVRSDGAPSLGDVPRYLLQLTPSLVAILLPAVLLIRHPDAPTRARTLFIGTVLYASVQGLLILGSALQPAFLAATPPPEELPSLVPLAIVYSLFTGLVGAFGLANIALGLARARQYEDAGSDRSAVFVAIAAILATIVGIIAVARLDFNQIPMSGTLVLYVASSVLIGVLRVTLWAALTAVTVRGWRAREEPFGAWRLAAASSAVVLLGLAIVNIVSVLQIDSAVSVTIYSYLVLAAFAAGHLGLLVAFALGLPSLDEAIEAEDDWDDDEADEPEEVLDQGGWPVADDPAG